MENTLGYYFCNGIEFRSKVNAFIYSNTVNKPVEWNFHQDIFAKYPWHIEPHQTLDELYNARAKQVREKYDYVILSFSGGADSNNMVEAFLRQGLYIDEIVTNHLSSAAKKTTILNPAIKDSSNFAAEHELQAMPRLKEISQRSPKTKITVLDVSETVIDSMKAYEDVDWVFDKNDHLSAGQLFRYNYMYFSDIKKRLDKNLKVGFVIGVDKPRTVIKNNSDFYLYFNDVTVNIALITAFTNEYTNTYLELFYWSPEATDLICKQAHVVKRWLESRPPRQMLWRDASFATVRTYHEPILRDLLYTTWNNNWFQTAKATSWFHTEFDTWFQTDQDLVRHRANWSRGIQYLVEKIPNNLIYNKDGLPDGLKTFRHDYFIGKIQNVTL